MYRKNSIHKNEKFRKIFEGAALEYDRGEKISSTPLLNKKGDSYEKNFFTDLMHSHASLLVQRQSRAAASDG